jgi:hypothetical protein
MFSRRMMRTSCPNSKRYIADLSQHRFAVQVLMSANTSSLRKSKKISRKDTHPSRREKSGLGGLAAGGLLR